MTRTFRSTLPPVWLAGTALLLLLAGPGCRRVQPGRFEPVARPAALPPAGLATSEVPQFVCFGSDDNGASGLEGSSAAGGLHYLTALFAGRRNPAGAGYRPTYDGTPARFSFYVNTRYLLPPGGPEAYAGERRDDPVWVMRAWREAVAAGHEIGVHTHSHPHGRAFTAGEWAAEMRRCIEILARPGTPSDGASAPGGLAIPTAALRGFRTPYLEYSDATLVAAERLGFAYDCSLEEGTEDGQDGTDFIWPYRLDHGSPADPAIGPHPGLWEVPVYVFVVPPDAECERYGVAPGLRRALQARRAYFDPGSGKITGMDWNLWCEFSMTPAEFLATIEYTLERRLEGNRCPLTIGLHSDLYSDRSGPGECAGTPAERRAALAALLDHVLRHEQVRTVTAAQLLAWLEHPRALRPAAP